MTISSRLMTACVLAPARIAMHAVAVYHNEDWSIRRADRGGYTRATSGTMCIGILGISFRPQNRDALDIEGGIRSGNDDV